MVTREKNQLETRKNIIEKHPMKKILFLCVNYNSYVELYNYLHSINEAAGKVKGKLVAKIMISDNTTDNYEEINTKNYNNIIIKSFPFHENAGYLGGISRIIANIPETCFNDYTYVVISNVDMAVPSDFFEKLLCCTFADNVAWIAPQIYSKKESRDRNPKILQRPDIKHICRLQFLYMHPMLYKLYTMTLYKIKRRKSGMSNRGEIYAGHGSFMIFSGGFFEKNRNFNFPVFLFGEELFFAELVQSSDAIVFYEPAIVVNDIDHVSTGKLSRAIYCKMNYDSLAKIKKYYE
jgi:GT2 family glycosyltransferase